MNSRPVIPLIKTFFIAQLNSADNQAFQFSCKTLYKVYFSHGYLSCLYSGYYEEMLKGGCKIFFKKNSLCLSLKSVGLQWLDAFVYLIFLYL